MNIRGDHRPQRPNYPPAPDGQTIYAIGDIHGRADLLAMLEDVIDADKTPSQSGQKVEIYLGDYIDRGPDSAGTVSRLIRRAKRTRAVFLRGNHEQFLLDFLDGKDCWGQWSAVGAAAFLLSYGINPNRRPTRTAAEEIRVALTEKMPPEHRHFYAQTTAYFCAGEYLFAHAGIRPGVSLHEQQSSDLLGIRQDFLDFDGDLGHIVVHGHTPVNLPELRHNRINIDTGAFATNRLTFLQIDGRGIQVFDTLRGARASPSV
jgi:serine/threonine protein phosphatase 1